MNNRGFTLLELVVVVAIVGILAAAVLPLARWSVKRQKEYELQQSLRILRNAIDRYHDMELAGLIESAPGGNGFPPDLDSLVEGVALTGAMPDSVPGVSDEYSATGFGLSGGFNQTGQSPGSPPPAIPGQGRGGFGNVGAGDPAFGARGAGGFGTRGQGQDFTGVGGGLSTTQRMAEQMREGRAGQSGTGFGAASGRSGGGLGGLGSDPRGARQRRRPGEEIEKIVFLRRIPVDPFTGSTDWGMRCYGEGPSDRSWCGRNVFDVYTKARGTGMDGRAYREW